MSLILNPLSFHPARFTRQLSRRRRSRPSSRRGAIVVMAAVMMIVLLAMVAFAIDSGYIALRRTELQSAADAAALAGAAELVNSQAAAKAEAIKYFSKNKVGGRNLAAENATFEFGLFNSGVFTLNNTSPNAIRVSASDLGQPLFFGGILGKKQFDSRAKAIAIYQPRDIAIVLDYSGSMCFDSQLRSIGLLGQAAVETNLAQIYAELGSPVYGTLKFTPVEYGTSGTSTTKVLKNFGLSSVAYPYPGGSWTDYVEYVQGDYYVNAAGYRNHYGYLTWINYLQARQGSSADTPGLWKVSEQPVTALKDAVDVFLSYLTAHSTDDQVALSIYTASDYTAKLEQALTTNYAAIATTCRQRQAGHYTGGTNISAGMNKGRLELENNARGGALKMMIVMTDGVVNMPTGILPKDKALVIQEAEACAAANIKLVTISVGALADTALMKQVAEIAGGASFIVPGGQPISQVEAQLKEVFSEVAADRPLKLVE